MSTYFFPCHCTHPGGAYCRDGQEYFHFYQLYASTPAPNLSDYVIDWYVGEAYQLLGDAVVHTGHLARIGPLWVSTYSAYSVYRSLWIHCSVSDLHEPLVPGQFSSHRYLSTTDACSWTDTILPLVGRRCSSCGLKPILKSFLIPLRM